MGVSEPKSIVETTDLNRFTHNLASSVNFSPYKMAATTTEMTLRDRLERMDRQDVSNHRKTDIALNWVDEYNWPKSDIV